MNGYRRPKTSRQACTWVVLVTSTQIGVANIMATYQDSRKWVTSRVLSPMKRFITDTREKCEEIGHWAEEKVTRPVEGWISQQERRYRELPWWNPLRWLCERKFSIDSGQLDNHIQTWKPTQHGMKLINSVPHLLWLSSLDQEQFDARCAEMEMQEMRTADQPERR